MTYETIIVEERRRVGLVRFDRPEALNALNAALLAELGEALAGFEANDAIGAIVITGSERAFAAGADVKEMAAIDFATAYRGDFLAAFDRVAAVRKPVIAAVAGYCLGGGCELAMSCDMIFAADTAKFGQPEVKLGVLPGAGGTQRLTRAVGKAKAMDMILTGRLMDATEAERCGLVARVFPAASLLDEALTAAETIGDLSLPAVMMAKESVNRAFETPLAEGMRFERRLFHAALALEDRAEGMAAFVEKREAQFKNR
jgi:enoyl-CoA hydratase